SVYQKIVDLCCMKRNPRKIPPRIAVRIGEGQMEEEIRRLAVTTSRPQAPDSNEKDNNRCGKDGEVRILPEIEPSSLKINIPTQAHEHHSTVGNEPPSPNMKDETWILPIFGGILEEDME